MKKKVVPTFRQEMKVKVDIVTSDDIKIYYTGKFQDFTARYIINYINFVNTSDSSMMQSGSLACRTSEGDENVGPRQPAPILFANALSPLFHRTRFI